MHRCSSTVEMFGKLLGRAGNAQLAKVRACMSCMRKTVSRGLGLCAVDLTAHGIGCLLIGLLWLSQGLKHCCLSRISPSRALAYCRMCYYRIPFISPCILLTEADDNS